MCGTEKPAMDGCFMGRKTSWRKEGSKWEMSRMQPPWREEGIYEEELKKG